MENILSIVFLVAAIASICLNVLLLQKLRNNSNKILEKQEKIAELVAEYHRSIAVLRETLEPAKPIRTNNWDSIRDVFKGPARIVKDGRN